MRKRTGHYDILVMAHEVLQNGERRRFHVHISPVNPRMVRPQGRTEKPVARLGHKLPPARLSGKTVTTLDILVDLLTKVFFNNGYFAIVLVGVFGCLDGLEVLH